MITDTRAEIEPYVDLASAIVKQTMKDYKKAFNKKKRLKKKYEKVAEKFRVMTDKITTGTVTDDEFNEWRSAVHMELKRLAYRRKVINGEIKYLHDWFESDWANTLTFGHGAYIREQAENGDLHLISARWDGGDEKW